ncbi:hypothetical protein NL676_000300 [Syzygium grande]|nr:hypothetical protein NL676_000300 [Syzygium grande]
MFIAGLWVVSVVGSWFNFVTLIYITFVLLHTIPVFYEKYEDQVDSFADKAMAEIKKQYAVLDGKVLSKIPRGPLKDKKRISQQRRRPYFTGFMVKAKRKVFLARVWSCLPL